MAVIDWFITKHKAFHYLKLRKFRDSPETIQLKILKRILKRNQNTQAGQQYQFDDINNYQDYKYHVPVRTADEYGSDLIKTYGGDHRVICHEKPFFFAMTAGSTGKCKHIPVTKSLGKEINTATLSYLHLFETACPDARKAPIQFLVGSAEGGESPNGIPKGFISGISL